MMMKTMIMVCGCTERKRQLTATSSEMERKDEEEWPMKDVVLVEDVRTVPIGKVLKVQCNDVATA